MVFRWLNRNIIPSGFVLVLSAAPWVGPAFAQSPLSASDSGRAYVSSIVSPYYEGQPIPEGHAQITLKCSGPGKNYNAKKNVSIEKIDGVIFNHLPVGDQCSVSVRLIQVKTPEGYILRVSGPAPKTFTVQAVKGRSDKGQRISLNLAVEPAPIQIPTLSCSSWGTLVSTGTDKETGASLPADSPDPVWEVASVDSMEDKTLVPIPADAWRRAIVVPPVNSDKLVWYLIRNQPANQPMWISANSKRATTKRTYYKYQFYLDKNTKPEDFSITAPVFADNQVLAVFVNGVRLEGNWGYAPGKDVEEPSKKEGTPQGMLNIYYGFKTGKNEIILLVDNTVAGATLTKPAENSGLFLSGNDICGGVTVKKTFSRPTVQPGGKTDLTITFTGRYGPCFKRYSHNGFPLITSDDLPAPLEVAGPATENSCNAELEAKVGGSHISMKAPINAVPDGKDGHPGKCHVTIPVTWPAKATGSCPGKVTNTIDPRADQTAAGAYFAIRALNTSAALQCELPAPDLQMNKTVHLLPDVSGPFKFTYTAACSLSGATRQIVGTLTVPGENKVVFPSIEGGSHCSISEAMPPAPAGYEWSKPPAGSWPIIVNIPAKGEPSPVNAPETSLKKAEPPPPPPPPPPPSPSSAHRIPVDSPLALLILGLGMAGAGGGAFWLRGRKHADRE